MSDVINGTKRTEFGKGAARRLRRAKQVPAVLYGHGTDPVHLALPTHDVFMLVKGSANAVVEISFEGGKELALVKSVQRDVVSNDIEHLDLLLVRRGEKVTVDVPVHVVGESAVGTNHQLELLTLELQAEATNIPEVIEVDVDGLTDGTVVRVGDLKLPQGVTTEIDPEADVLTVSEIRVVEDEADTETGAEEA
ncbi:LSU ribosomal protein L25P [Salana multivorans]|uniref:Large ribosomal subunit protein bL25 n=1 Tax=Salana multivorans TaxID=120377 RepID=A0A3N2D7V7_9MICO|nr:50S ribosomal protein L25/general stress protein Ctc [Salana multivorans]OJX94008.1 MAG: 50S ribosomal protein L25/general stress protein Ctc [Micrococcales bacterium 73-15]ROR95876.1 LSU ribosomal protein L25P [Salana multivorans]